MIMKKLFSTILVALVATVASYAQTIAVVSSAGQTTMYQSLNEAVEGAESGSVIYLPGGGFQISEDTKINKKLTIMGVSHRADTDNAEGATLISGNVNFTENSDGSCLEGIYVSGNVNVGVDNTRVRNILIRRCNVNSIQVSNNNCDGMIVNQCYLRASSTFGGCNVKLENNIIHSLKNINGGKIDHNIVVHSFFEGWWAYALREVYNSIITNNMFFFGDGREFYSGDGCTIQNNTRGSIEWGENSFKWDEGTTWDDVFVKNNGISITSDFHLKGTFGKGKATDGGDVGLYLNSAEGTGFDDKALAPIPRIVSKEIPEQTDASGKLNIKITVKAK